MTTKEYAFRIFSLMRTEISLLHDSELLKDKIAKQLAFISVDEILKEIEDIDDGQTFIPYEYWNEVKHELEKL